MVAEWMVWVRAAGWKVRDGRIVVELGRGRWHFVEVEEVEGVLQLTADVVGGQATAFEDLERNVWLRNRQTAWVTFRFGARGRLLGELSLPVAGLEAAEFVLAVQTLASECDRFEFQLTGKDRL